MTSEEFRDLLQRQTDLQLLDLCLRDDLTPYVFQPRPTAWETFRNELVSTLDISHSDVRVVGSGRFGFSMKPSNKFKRFADTSDIDVVIVSAALFDQLWLALLEAAYPRPPITEMPRIGGWLRARRYELYTGWLTPLEIKLDSKIFGAKAVPVLEFNARWFNALKQASRHPPRRHSDITGRLYRTWEHADLYHLNSLAALRNALAE